MAGQQEAAAQYVVHQPYGQPVPLAVTPSAAGPGAVQMYPGAHGVLTAVAGAPLAAPGTPGMLGNPMRPSSEIADPESIEKQKKGHEQRIEAEVEQHRRVLEAHVKQRKEQLKLEAEHQMALYKAQIEQRVKQEEMTLEQDQQQQNMQLQQWLLQQKSLLEQTAAHWAMEYQQRKMREDIAKHQQEMQQEMLGIQQKMEKEMAAQQAQAAQLQAQHMMQAQQFQQLQMQAAAAQGQVPHSMQCAMPVYTAAVPLAGPAPGQPMVAVQQGSPSGRPAGVVAAQSYAAYPATTARFAPAVVQRPPDGAYELQRQVQLPMAVRAAVPGGYAAAGAAAGGGCAPVTTTTYLLAAPNANGNVPPSAASMVYGQHGVGPAGQALLPGCAREPLDDPRRVAMFDMSEANHDPYLTRDDWHQA